MAIHIEQVTLPSFGMPAEPAPISVEEYRQRLVAAEERMAREGLDVLVVYGDREHAANLAFLTGFDPRFEEALLLLDREGQRMLLVGNECMGYLPDPALGCEVVLFQEFSLLGQPRGSSAPLWRTLAAFGIGPGVNVGCVGWKYFERDALIESPLPALEIPAYLVDLLRDLTGNAARVRNAGALFMHPADGLRVINSADQLAQFEFASARTAESVHAVLAAIHPGVAERALAPLLDDAGLPRSCHPMISFGEKVRRGLSSPGGNVAQLGDPFTVAFGVTGGLTCRAGAVAHEAHELAPDLRDFYPRFVANYFAVAAAWYRALAVGAVSGEVYAAAEAQRNLALYDFSVNPGHYLHLDEWVHSPFAPGSKVVLRSGMALQMDIIPVSHGPFCYVNAEDGVVLADAALRAELAARHPDCWQRMQQRRQFMIETLGIPLDESVLPLSNTPGWLAPYILAPEMALVCR